MSRDVQRRANDDNKENWQLTGGQHQGGSPSLTTSIVMHRPLFSGVFREPLALDSRCRVAPEPTAAGRWSRSRLMML